MAKTVADQFMEILAAAGVKRIYGVVGDSLNGLTDSLRRQAVYFGVGSTIRRAGGHNSDYVGVELNFGW